MDLHVLGGSAAGVKAAVVTAIALPILVASAPASNPPAAPIVGRQEKPATTGTTPERSFLIGSIFTAPLFPGATVPVNLTLANPNAFGIDVRELTIGVERVDAGAGCGPDDFATRQFAGRYGLRVGSAQKIDLGTLGIDPADWPQITMIDRPENQDGCKGVRLQLKLAGTAVGLAP